VRGGGDFVSCFLHTVYVGATMGLLLVLFIFAVYISTPTLLLAFQLVLVLERPLTIKTATHSSRKDKFDRWGDDISTIDNIQCY